MTLILSIIKDKVLLSFCSFMWLGYIYVWMQSAGKVKYVLAAASNCRHESSVRTSHKITLAVLLLKWKACLEIVQGS